jgi:hypothetical protein
VLLAAAMGVVAAASLLLRATAQARGRAGLVEVRLANPPARTPRGARSTVTRPLRRLASAVRAADAAGKPSTASGTYTEGAGLASRVGVYGGYAPAKARSLTNATRITGAAMAAGDTEGALALNISATTTVQLATLAPDAPTALGASSDGRRGLNSSGLRLERVSVLGASARPARRGRAARTGRRAATAALASDVQDGLLPPLARSRANGRQCPAVGSGSAARRRPRSAPDPGRTSGGIGRRRGVPSVAPKDPRRQHMVWKRTVLVIANQTAPSDELLAHLTERAEAVVHVVDDAIPL